LEQYTILDHEADVGFEVYGSTEEGLFQSAVCALFSLITDLDLVHPALVRRVEIDDDSSKSLIIFLNDLIYLWEVERFIPKTITLDGTGGKMAAIIMGEFLDESRHPLINDVKAVTYHQFSREEEPGRLKATFIVDL